jgi:hypothetical protein
MFKEGEEMINPEWDKRLREVYGDGAQYEACVNLLIGRDNKYIYKSLEKRLRKWLADESPKYKYPFSTNQMLFLIL